MSTTLLEESQALSSIRGAQLTNEERGEKAVAIAELLLDEAVRVRTRDERKIQGELARMMEESDGKVFTTYMADQCFRSENKRRVANQLCYLLDRFGVPQYLGLGKRIGLHLFRLMAPVVPGLLMPLVTFLLRKEMSRVILPGESDKLGSHMEKRRSQGVRVNLNHLGEAILGEEEAERRVAVYLEDLAKPEVDYISVKSSTIFSQINLLAWDETLEALAGRLRSLYRAAGRDKFVNLDMEEYQDLHLTLKLLQKVLDEPEFKQQPAGIVLQAYLPDSFPLQQELTEWAMKRVKGGGAPIKIRIVKGANLAMERVDASLHGWEQAPYGSKEEVDANFKRMVVYGCQAEHAQAASLGIGSHNLFDIAFAMVLRAECGTEDQICFEMLEGMADHMRRVVQDVSGDMLLYCPASKQHEFQNAVAYLIRRLDENTAPDNFLHDSFGMEKGSPEWDKQKERFMKACMQVESAAAGPKRSQNRLQPPRDLELSMPFENEADTDWSLQNNRDWIEQILRAEKERTFGLVPVVIGGKEILCDESEAGEDPSRPGVELYRVGLADEGLIEAAVVTAKHAEKEWSETALEERRQLLVRVASKLRERRGTLIARMMADGGKTAPEADTEISEAIDFAEYYARSAKEHADWDAVRWSPKGTILVTPPWNFPLAIPLGGVLASLVTGNCVIFKPAKETSLVAWEGVKLIWEAGCSKEVLQFVTCADEPTGSRLIQDQRINAVVLTGASDTATLFQTMRPNLDLMAETGGKNALIVTELCDRDLAIADVIQSAFGHAGQKCSACSLLILEKGLYNDVSFRRQLRDAAESLSVGSAWDPRSKVNPMIHPPSGKLLKALTTLEEGEEWLLQSKCDDENPRIWSPAIRWGVKRGSFTHRTELFGPHLSVICAEDLDDAISIANDTPYGLTSGIHTLDDREADIWIEEIEVGNCYINRGITGAIVRRQPFGGCKASSFGRGSKAGGPNYLSQLMHVEEGTVDEPVGELTDQLRLLETILSDEERDEWQRSAKSYAYWMEHYFSKDHDPSQVIGQDNLLRYSPHDHVVLRVQPGDRDVDLYRVCAAALVAGTFLEISCDNDQFEFLRNEASWSQLPNIQVIHEEWDALKLRIEIGAIHRLRFLTEPDEKIYKAVTQTSCRLAVQPVLAFGRLELLHYLREVSISRNYHRYGNLGERESMEA